MSAQHVLGMSKQSETVASKQGEWAREQVLSMAHLRTSVQTQLSRGKEVGKKLCNYTSGVKARIIRRNRLAEAGRTRRRLPLECHRTCHRATVAVQAAPAIHEECCAGASEWDPAAMATIAIKPA